MFEGPRYLKKIRQMSEENWSCLVTIFLFKKRLPAVFGISITRVLHAHFSIVVPLEIFGIPLFPCGILKIAL